MTAKEAVEALKHASYDLKVQETKVHLVNELAEVCRDYCQEVWMEAFNLAGVPATSEWRKAENIFYPADIREVPAMFPPPTAPAPTSSEPPLLSKPLFLLLLLNEKT